ncbi:DUF3576 domain-containing protein [Alkalilacustris brevis]|uniref:DUF3576 domain-containing protein n=1 Tax=Alkalilacustris brevis TaxID=2026338 RepID=UPI00138FB17B|nr:DUF3576 domain-containing protein [Alkalilacustris brevis]
MLGTHTLRAGTIFRAAVLIGLVASLGACGGTRLGDMFGRGEPVEEQRPLERADAQRESTIWDLFTNVESANTTVEVNRYLWNATLEVLDFLPVQTVDPFSGVLVTGFGTPPGGGQAYRAAVLVNDPALDARSLKVALMTRSGPASPATIRAVEDAILTRARQMRIRDMGL